MDHHIGRLIRVLVLLMVLPTAVVVFLRILGDGLGAALGGFLDGVPGIAAVLVLVVGAVVFGVGLVVRAASALAKGDPAGRRKREAGAQRARLAVRRPATDVPAHGPGRRTRPDSDPALPLD